MEKLIDSIKKGNVGFLTGTQLTPYSIYDPSGSLLSMHTIHTFPTGLITYI